LHKLHTVYTVSLAALAALSGIASAWVTYNTEPAQGLGSLTAFYASTGLFTLSLVALAGYLVRARFGIREKVKRHFYVSLRQGAWVGLLFVASMYLESVQLFSWASSGLLVVALTFLESYYLNNERKPQPDQDGSAE